MSNPNEKEQAELLEQFPYRMPGNKFIRGVLYHMGSTDETMDNVHGMELMDGDIFVNTFPKSGTTWMQHIITLILDETNAHTDRQTDVMTDRFPYIEFKWAMDDINYDGMAILDGKQSPRTMKTHLQYSFMPKQCEDKDVRMVYVARNPKDVAVSYFSFYKKNPLFGSYEGTFSDFLDMFCAGFVAHGDWFQMQKTWWDQKENPKVYITTYEALKRNIAGEIQNLATFLNRSLTETQIERIVENSSMSNMKAHAKDQEHMGLCYKRLAFFRKGMVGDWKNYFTVAESEAFDAWYRKKCDDLGLEDFKLEFSS